MALVAAWMEEANIDLQAAVLLMESGFHAQTVFLSQQAAAKAWKGALLQLNVPEGTGQHPAALFEELLKKSEGESLKTFQPRLERLLKTYRLLEKEAGSARFPQAAGDRVVSPHRETKAFHSAKALTAAREIIGLTAAIVKDTLNRSKAGSAIL